MRCSESRTAGRLLKSITFIICLCLLFYLFITIFHIAIAPLRNSDAYWQVRTGEIILDSGKIPDTDPFSYTIAGSPWNNHQWGYEILVALLYRCCGWAGFRIATAAIFLTLSFLIVFVIIKRHGPAEAVLVLSLFIQLAFYKFNPACQTLSIFLPAYYFFARADTFISSWKTSSLCLLLFLWGNLTAEVVVFLPFIAADVVLEIISRRSGASASESRPETLHSTRWIFLLFLGAMVMPLLNPPESSVLDYVLEGTMVNQLVNNEFTPLWLEAASVYDWSKLVARFIVIVFILLSAVAVIRGPRRIAILRRYMPGLLCVCAAVLYERNIWMLIIPVVIMLGDLQSLSWFKKCRGSAGIAILAIALLIHVPFAVESRLSPARTFRELSLPWYYSTDLDYRLIPLSCADAIRRDHANTKVFTRRLWASYLIHAAPASRVFYDGRNREYPMEIHMAGREIETAGPNANALLDATGTDIVMAQPGWNRKNRLLQKKWIPAGSAPNCSIFVRRKP